MPVEDPIRTGTIEQPLQTSPNEPQTAEERSAGALCHFAGILGWPGALICWLMKKDTSKWVDQQGKAALNFQITNAILFAVLLITICGGPAVGIYNLIITIMVGMKVQKGEPYKYPFSFNFIK